MIELKNKQLIEFIYFYIEGNKEEYIYWMKERKKGKILMLNEWNEERKYIFWMKGRI